MTRARILANYVSSGVTAAELDILDGVTATAAELNIMDGVTATAAELNLIDGGTSRGTTAIVSGDGVLVNDGGTMRMTNVDTLDTYLSATTKTLTNKTLTSPTLTTPALGTPASGVMTNMTGAVTASIVDDAITLAKMAGGTDGTIITFDASGNPVAVGPGSDGQVLTSTGAGSPPAFEDAGGGGGGKVLQVVQSGLDSTQHSTSGTGESNTGLTADITITDGSKVLILVSLSFHATGDFYLRIKFGGTVLLGGGDPTFGTHTNSSMAGLCILHDASGEGTGPHTYHTAVRALNGTVYTEPNSTAYSSMVLMEIGA